ncbi:unnamed protein product [Cunninghamella blakesleeana]
MTYNKKVPAHPAYEPMIKAMNDARPGWFKSDPAALRQISNNVILPPGIKLADTLVEEKVVTVDLQDVDDDQQTSSTLTLTISRPLDTENKSVPAFIYLHGGGFIVGSYKVSEHFIKDLTVNANAAVITVDYSLAPEAKFPIAVEECFSTLLWIHQHAEDLKIDASRLFVGGDSAGGNLAAVSALLLKKRGHGNVLKGQVLMYPVVSKHLEKNESTELYGQGGYILNYTDMEYVRQEYLGDKYSGKEFNDTRFSPLFATDEELKGLPSSLIITGECDLLRDEGEEYARRLVNAGVDATGIRYIGAPHGFLTAMINSSIYRQAVDTISKFINTSF